MPQEERCRMPFSFGLTQKIQVYGRCGPYLPGNLPFNASAKAPPPPAVPA